MKVTNKIKALSTMTLAAATLFLAGCQAQSNTLTFAPQSPTASMNINQSAVVTVNTRDSRPQQEIATYTKSGELIKLNALTKRYSTFPTSNATKFSQQRFPYWTSE